MLEKITRYVFPYKVEEYEEDCNHKGTDKVRGNVYARLYGTITEEEHDKLMEAARNPISLEEIESIERERRKKYN
jgi:hypothetical protein